MARRYLSWDRYRACAMLLMVVVNDLATARGIPAWLKHSPGAGYTIADLVAPMFIFAMGLTFGPSFGKRFAENRWDACVSAIRRNLAFIGLGAVFSGVGVYFQADADWGVLQALGVAGLMTLCTIRLPAHWRALVALLILSAYQVSLTWLSPLVLGHLHGGMVGALSWGAMLMITTALVELYQKNMRLYWAAVALLMALGLAISPAAPISKPLVSASYVFVSLALCGALFWLCGYIENRFRLESRRDFLCDWGENPLAIYLAHYALIGVTHTLNLFMDPPIWVSLPRTALILFSLNALARWMHKRGVRIAL